MNRREFQLIEGTSQKFWAIELDAAAHSVHFGRIGTAGQTSRKEFATEAQAKASYEKLIAEKLKKGYVEGAATTTAAAATSAAPIAAEVKPTPKPKQEADPPGTKAAPAPTPVVRHRQASSRPPASSNSNPRTGSGPLGGPTRPGRPRAGAVRLGEMPRSVDQGQPYIPVPALGLEQGPARSVHDPRRGPLLVRCDDGVARGGTCRRPCWWTSSEPRAIATVGRSRRGRGEENRGTTARLLQLITDKSLVFSL